MGPVRRCLDQHRESISKTTQISIQYSIDASGRAQRVTVSPGSVMGSAMGQCIVGAARGIEFGPQPAPANFSIPITMEFK